MQTGDVALVSFPFANLLQTKIRPAVVVTTTRDKYEDVIVCFVSSVVPSKLNDKEIILIPDKVNNLRASSVIKVYRIATIEKDKIISVIGKLSTEKQAEFIAAFRSLI